MLDTKSWVPTARLFGLERERLSDVQTFVQGKVEEE